jgi:adenylate cyclase
MSTNADRDPLVEEVWSTYLTTGKPPVGIKASWFESPGMRAVARRLPSDPRCQACSYPFGGLGGKLVRSFLHLEPSKMNPHLCNICERFAEAHLGGAELEVSLLFADIRGSTPLAATMNAYEFSRLIGRYYQVATNMIYKHGGMVEKLVGDGVVAFFVPAFTANHNYARASIEAGQDILLATGHGSADRPWVPVGVGIHTGPAYVGAVGEPGKNVEITVLGDSVNIAARLSSQAQEGEIVISADTVRSAGLDTAGHEFRSVDLKGKEEPLDVWVQRVRAS